MNRKWVISVLKIPRDISEVEALELCRHMPRVRETIAGKSIVQEIYVPGRLVSFVV